jgi:hypothetical protein
MAVALVAGHYWEDISLACKVAIGSLVVGSLVAGWKLSERDNRSFVAEFVWPTQYFLMGRAARKLVDSEVADAEEEMSITTKLTAAETYASAMEQEIDGLDDWVFDVEQVLSAAISAEQDLWTEASRRLAEARDLASHIRTTIMSETRMGLSPD